MREFVEQHDIGLFAKRRLEVEVFEGPIADSHLPRRNARQSGGGALQIRPPLRFDPTDRDALAVGRKAARVLQEASRLARTGRACDVDDESRTSAQLAQQLLRLRRTIHGCSLREGARRPRRAARKRASVALLCYALLVAAWIVDLVTPQLFIAAILLNGPIALSSLALQSRLTTKFGHRRTGRECGRGLRQRRAGGSSLGRRCDRGSPALGGVVRAGWLLEHQDAGVRARGGRLGRADAAG